MVEEKEVPEKKTSKARGEARDFPVIQLEDAIEVAKRVKELGGYATVKDIGAALGLKGGGLARKIASTKRWGLIKGAGQLNLTDLGRWIFFPTEDTQPEKAKIKAFFGVSLFKTIYQRFKESGQLPADNLLKNTLINSYQLTENDAATVTNIIKKSVSTIVPFDKNFDLTEESTIEPSINSTTTSKPDFVVESENKKMLVEIKSIYETARNIGRLEEMAKNENMVEIKKEDFAAIIKDLLNSSSNFPTLHTILVMTDEEIENDIIPVASGLKRIKFIVKNFETDINYQPAESDKLQNGT